MAQASTSLFNLNVFDADCPFLRTWARQDPEGSLLYVAICLTKFELEHCEHFVHTEAVNEGEHLRTEANKREYVLVLCF